MDSAVSLDGRGGTTASAGRASSVFCPSLSASAGRETPSRPRRLRDAETPSGKPFDRAALAKNRRAEGIPRRAEDRATARGDSTTTQFLATKAILVTPQIRKSHPLANGRAAFHRVFAERIRSGDGACPSHTPPKEPRTSAARETCGDLWYSRKVRKDGKHDASDDWLSLPAGLHEVAETPAADTRRARKKKF